MKKLLTILAFALVALSYGIAKDKPQNTIENISAKLSGEAETTYRYQGDNKCFITFKADGTGHVETFNADAAALTADFKFVAEICTTPKGKVTKYITFSESGVKALDKKFDIVDLTETELTLKQPLSKGIAKNAVWSSTIPAPVVEEKAPEEATPAAEAAPAEAPAEAAPVADEAPAEAAPAE